MKRLLCLGLALAMLFALAACGGGGTTVDDGTTGVRLDSKGNLLYKPEDVGTLANPVVTGLISPAPDDDWYAQEIGWKETAYGIEYDYDVCACCAPHVRYTGEIGVIKILDFAKLRGGIRKHQGANQ